MERALGGWQLLLSTRYRLSFLIICLCEAVPAAAGMIYGTILPSALGDIGGVELAAWAAQVYAVAGIVGAAAMGRAIGRFGFQNVALFAGFNFIIGSLICAMADNFTIVLVGRTPQGFGAGLIGALGYALVKPIFPQETWTRIFAALSAVWGIAAVMGPALGAAFIELGGWRGAFYALAAIGLFLSIFLFAMTQRLKLLDGDKGGHPPPLLRLTLLAVGSFLLASAGIIHELEQRLIFAAIGVLALITLVRWDQMAVHALLPRQAFQLGSPLGVLLILCFLMSLSEMSYTVYGALILQTVYDFSPLEAGYGLVVFAIGWTVAEVFSAHAPVRFARQILVMGPVFLISGMMLVAMTVGHASPGYVILGGFLMGCAMGIVWPHLISMALRLGHGEDDAIIAGAVPTLQRVGLALGAAIAGVLANSAGLSHGLSAETMTNAARWTHIGMTIPMFFILFVLLRQWNVLRP